MANLKAVVVDCTSPLVLARFWSSALDEFEIRPYDEAEIARLAALGFTPETDPAVILDGPRLELCFQRTDLERRSKKPIHFDIAATDLDAEIQRLLSLGATVRQRFEDHAWMLDPEHNDFCVFQAD